jgi:hypothetical protein
MANDLSHLFQCLEKHLVATDFKGIDPHDGLNSPLVKALTFGDRRLGVAALQLFKRCPVNLRPLFGIRPGTNPKGNGLLVATYVQKYRMTGEAADLARAKEFADWLIENQSLGCSGAAWGYNFDWPNRNAIFPAGTPTIVNTAYIAEAFLDLFEVTGDEKYKITAVSSAEFLLKDLNRSSDTGHEFCFSYTPRDQTQIHNANMLGATLLARISALTGDARMKQAAQASMRFSINRQQPDGSWLYGTEPRNSWIDSYHTGYNLLAIQRYIQSGIGFQPVHDSQDGCPTLEESLCRGYSFYLDHFFTPEGFVKYYHDRTYPWDGHAMAHALLTLDELEYLDPERSRAIREKVIARIQDTFWDARRGCFLYLINKRSTNRIDYYRWVQCWIFYALMNHQLKAGGLSER